MYAVGSLSQLLGSMSKSAMGFYVWKCGRYEADYYSNSRMDYFFYDYEYYDYVQRLVKHFKICKKKIVFRGTQSIATGPILIFLSCNIRQIRENVFLSGQRLSYNTLPVSEIVMRFVRSYRSFLSGVMLQKFASGPMREANSYVMKILPNKDLLNKKFGFRYKLFSKNWWYWRRSKILGCLIK